ncbi:MAG: hypothetical protein H6730_17510 [Deltaproteobacteria bacterium]|nr:hypothetical protein [Deltaproteobacteria bacterium]
MRRAACSLALLALTLAGPARADDTHYHDYPIGGRAVGLGGAFVALASDPSGLYYNPAGIVDSRHHSVQISTNLYGLEVADTFFDALGQVGELQTVFADLNIIPSSAAFTGVIDADDDGKPTTSYALGSFVPSYRSLNLDSASESDIGPCRQLSYERSLLDRTFLFGAAAGHRLDDTWQFGTSAFLAYRSLRDREEVACFGDGSAFSSASTNLNLSAASLLLSFGIKAHLGHNLYLGGTITSPSIRLFDSGSIRVRRGGVDPDSGDSEFLLKELTDLTANTRYSTAIRVGLAWVIPGTATLAFDADFRAPTKYDLVELPPGETEIRDAITLTTHVERRAVLNMNLGGEYLLTKSLSVALGLFTNFSTAPNIPGAVGDTFKQDSLPDIDAFGGSLVLGFFGEYTLTRAGFTMSYGEGTDVVPSSQGLAALGQATDYLKVDYSQLFLYFFVSSTFRY